MTSPPFGLVRQKDYGNVTADEYLKWFKPFAVQLKRVLKEQGSLVIDIGGAWTPGLPVRSVYHFKLLVMLVEKFGFHLAQEIYWWNPARIPGPAEWVNIRRVRVKDAVNCVWWLSPSPWPKASNRRVLQPYSDSHKELLATNDYNRGPRPSGWNMGENFGVDNGGAIPPNLIALPNTESSSYYLRYCREHQIEPHPARYPAALPEYFIRMLTDRGDLVVDPFAGSCVTGEVSERLERRWICAELEEEYLRGAEGRFMAPLPRPVAGVQRAFNIVEDQIEEEEISYYKLPRPGALWNGHEPPLVADGGRARPQRIILPQEVAEFPADLVRPAIEAGVIEVVPLPLEEAAPMVDPILPPTGEAVDQEPFEVEAADPQQSM
jgi:site-specific DNA-methyltransferase (cytosine-N4-specific)